LSTEETAEGVDSGHPKSPSKSGLSRSNSRFSRNKSPFPIGKNSGSYGPHPSMSSSTAQNLEPHPLVVTTPPSPITGPASPKIPTTLIASSSVTTATSQNNPFKTLPSLPTDKSSMPNFSSSAIAHSRSTTMTRKRSGTLTSHHSQLSNSHHSMAIDMSTSDSGVGGMTGNDELTEVRRRRTEVNRRYEARLNFLRAKLKGVEMRERLSRT
jgi:hypothetical protein